MTCPHRDQVYLDDFQAYHQCEFPAGSHAAHLCGCGHTWGTARTAAEEIENDNLPLNFILSEKQIIDIFLTVDSNNRNVDQFIHRQVRRGRMSTSDGQRAMDLGHQAATRILTQITEQYPVIAARAEQVRAQMKEAGIIE